MIPAVFRLSRFRLSRLAVAGIVLLASTALTLGAGWWLKEQCVDHNWNYPKAWYCYSDLGVLYGSRGFEQDRVPYFQEFNEYPPVVGFVQYGAALLSSSVEAFIHWNEFFLALFAMGTTACLIPLAGPRRHLLVWWAFGPPLVLYAFHNWDLVAVFLATLALLCFRRGRAATSGVLLGLGFYAKFYPILFAPILGLALLRREKGLGPSGWRFGLGVVGTLAAIAAPFLALAPRNFISTFTFHIERGPTIESFWNIARHYAGRWHHQDLYDFLDKGTLAFATNAAILAVVAYCAWAVWRGRLSWLEGCAGAVIGFMAFNQVVSVQYSLWLLPFLALLPISPARRAFFLVSDALTYWGIFHHFGHQDEASLEQLAVATTLRFVALLVLLAQLVSWSLRRRPSSPPVLELEIREALGAARPGMPVGEDDAG